MNKLLWRSTTGQLCYRIDNSTLHTVKECPRKAYHTYILGRITARARPALDFGGAIHKALEGPVSGSNFGEALHRALEQPDKTEPSLDAAFAVLEKAYKDIQVPEDDYRHLGRAREVIEAYVRHWKNDRLRVLSIEKPFMVPLGRVDGVVDEPIYVFWTGRIDKIALNHLDKLWAVDHKTGSKVGERDNLSWENASQFKGYVFALEQSLPGRKVEGVIVDRIIVRPPVVRETSKTQPRNQFFRIPATFTAEQITEWQRDTLRHIAHWLTMARDEHWPMNDNSCPNYGGCPFWTVCTVMDQSCRPSLLSGLDFTDNTWDPLKT